MRAKTLRKRKTLILVLVLGLFLFSFGSSFAEIRVFFSPKGGIAEEIMKQISYIKEWGGRFLIAIPEVRVL